MGSPHSAVQVKGCGVCDADHEVAALVHRFVWSVMTLVLAAMLFVAAMERQSAIFAQTIVQAQFPVLSPQSCFSMI
jgi:hypothetical protein